jgi:hypothetical protein
MKTKTLVLAAAALTACALTASAQSNVYSLNIVGYVNVTVNPSADGVTPAFTLLANPLDNGIGNTLSNLVPAGLSTGSRVWTFDPTAGYSSVLKKSTGAWATSPTIAPGTGYFISTTNTTALTNTYVGNVPGSVPGSLTNNLTFGTSGFNLVGSPYPIGGGMTNTGSNTINLPSALPTGSRIWTFDSVLGYSSVLKKSTGAWASNPNLQVGQGFFVNNPSNTPVTWIQNVGP